MIYDMKLKLIIFLLAAAVWDIALADNKETDAPLPSDSVPGFTDMEEIPLPGDSLMRMAVTFSPVDLREPIFDDYASRPYPTQVIQMPATMAQKLLRVNSMDELDRRVFSDSLINALKQNYMIRYPQYVRYNVRELPDPPKRYRSVVDPSTLRIVLEEIPMPKKNLGKADIVIKRANWLHTFNGSVQFSQAYISPNWYQGGNSALSMLANVTYQLQLNRKFHPEKMFELYTNYKLAIASTPDDSLRKYSITEDVFQLTIKGGLKAANHWFYSTVINFKTQFFNNYPINSPIRSASFLSPGDLNVGVGMTYDYTSKNNKFHIDASISPLSWNLKTCIDPYVNPETVGIEPGHKTKSQIGSSIEVKYKWKVTRDITYSAQIFGFTVYKETQVDWENTIDFAINKFLSARFYANLRYDSTTPHLPDSKWYHWQFKEILSFGFSYNFGTI